MEISRQLILKGHSPSDTREPVASAKYRSVRATSNYMIRNRKIIYPSFYLLHAVKENIMFAQTARILMMYQEVVTVL
ncbi:hypothetical protein SAMN05216379_11719 [Nitrosomonas eutropha]|nr:hypothetical protein SAMN05216379_11719 [Nitrosomonas eutropha]